MNKNSQNPTEQVQADTVQAQQEPVAWMYEWNGRTYITTADQRPIEHAHPHFNKSKPLYAAPQPPVQQEPVAWRVRPFNYGIGYEGVDALTTRKEQCEMWQRKGWKVEQLYAVPQPTENLRCKSTQKRLATLWGYVKPQHLQPLTDEQMYALYCEAMKGYYVSSLHYWRNEEAHKFARAIEEAHGIGSTHG